MIDLNLYIRQMGLCDPEKLDFPIMIIGAGSIGGWSALALCKLGCQNVTVIDFDTCEEHNAGSQVFTSLDVGKKKVEALQERLIGLVESIPQVEVKKIEPGQTDFLKEYKIIISAVDNIETRKVVFEALKGTDSIFIDGRMAGNVLQVFTIPMDDKERVKFYESTLFPTEEEDPTSCSERSVSYNVFTVAGKIACNIAKIANGKMPPQEIEEDLLNVKLYTS